MPGSMLRRERGVARAVLATRPVTSRIAASVMRTACTEYDHHQFSVFRITSRSQRVRSLLRPMHNSISDLRFVSGGPTSSTTSCCT